MNRRVFVMIGSEYTGRGEGGAGREWGDFHCVMVLFYIILAASGKMLFVLSIELIYQCARQSL